MKAAFVPTKYHYSGLLIVTFTTLMYEILLTRIFSVIAYYHFAFMVVSVAMFGMTVGALLVYLLPYFRKNDLDQILIFNTALFALSMAICFILVLALPLQFTFSLSNILIITLVYFLLSIPFIFSGVCVCLLLTQFPGRVNSLYAVDLIGAGAGCLIIILLLNIFTGVTALFIIAMMSSLGVVLFNKGRFNAIGSLTLLFLMIVAGSNFLSERINQPLFHLAWVKDSQESKPLYEKWNSFSRLTVSKSDETDKPWGWGLSTQYPYRKKIDYLWLLIDGKAGTPLTRYQHLKTDIDYLKYDVINLPYYIRQKPKVLIVGVGGGRDILSALLFNASFITGLEVNNDILKLVNDKFGAYTGNLNKLSNIRFINQEARSYLSLSKDKFDIIQMSLIDTWAATSAGAYTLTENALYTKEAWADFLNHLSPTGIFSVSRFYSQTMPLEMYRLATLAMAALKDAHVKEPWQHIMIVAGKTSPKLTAATLLFSPEAFTEIDIKSIQQIAQKLHFQILYAPLSNADPRFDAILHGQNPTSFNKLLFDISPPSDDKPFFFQMLNIKDIFTPTFWKEGNNYSFNNQSVTVLGLLLIAVMLLTTMCIVLPLSISQKTHQIKNNAGLMLFFLSIGLGFMLIEISQIQRLSLFLGHPTYGLSVVLFTLLISCGIGSMSGTKINQLMKPSFSILLIPIILTAYFFYSHSLIDFFKSSTEIIRILIASLMLFPIGLSMGIALPLGIKTANENCAEITPWLWGINGAASISGAVLAVAISLASGITMTYWLGVVCYVIANGFFLIRKRKSSIPTC